METAEPALVAEFLIGGITRADVQQDAGLMWQTADPTTMLLPPLPNFLFQRDCSCWIFSGVTINPMTKTGPPARNHDHGSDLPVPPDVHRLGVPHLAGRHR